jgi:hypothetical protein
MRTKETLHDLISRVASLKRALSESPRCHESRALLRAALTRLEEVEPASTITSRGTRSRLRVWRSPKGR